MKLQHACCHCRSVYRTNYVRHEQSIASITAYSDGDGHLEVSVLERNYRTWERYPSIPITSVRAILFSASDIDPCSCDLG